MRMRRFHLPAKAKSTVAGARARGSRPWQVVAASTAAAFAVGYFGTMVVRDNTATTPTAATAPASPAARPAASPSPALAALGTGKVDPAVKPYLNKALLKEVPVGPGPVAKPVKTVLTSARVITALGASGIPLVAQKAYQHAATLEAASNPACHLPWQMLAAIGRVESDNGQFGGSQLLSNGNTTRPILGIPLDGRNGVALIRDTDGGKLDGDPNFDRAVGPMQFIPSTWASDGADGNGDGVKDPNNIYDAALAAANYLCAGGGNMTVPAQAGAAVRSYNDADEYVRVVLALTASYEHGGYATIPAAVAPAVGSTSAPVTPAAPPAPARTKAPAPAPARTRTPAPAPARSTPPARAPKPVPAASRPAPPAPSAGPSRVPHPVATPPRHHHHHGVNIGWAPAMRQVVVKILTTPEKTPAGSACPTPSPSASTPPARETATPAPTPSASPAVCPDDSRKS